MVRNSEFAQLMRNSSLGTRGARRTVRHTPAEDAAMVARLVELRAVMADHGTAPAAVEAARELVEMLAGRGYPWRDEIPDELVLHLLQTAAVRPETADPAAGQEPGGPVDRSRERADALAVITSRRRALADGNVPAETLVLEALGLARAMGQQLVMDDVPDKVQAAARALSQTGRDSHQALTGQPAPDEPAKGVPLEGLSGVDQTALHDLAALLGELGIALVAVACGTDDEPRYWQCITAIDAVDEAGDRVRALLRSLLPSTP